MYYSHTRAFSLGCTADSVHHVYVPAGDLLLCAPCVVTMWLQVISYSVESTEKFVSFRLDSARNRLLKVAAKAPLAVTLHSPHPVQCDSFRAAADAVHRVCHRSMSSRLPPPPLWAWASSSPASSAWTSATHSALPP